MLYLPDCGLSVLNCRPGDGPGQHLSAALWSLRKLRGPDNVASLPDAEEVLDSSAADGKLVAGDVDGVVGQRVRQRQLPVQGGRDLRQPGHW